MTRKTLRRTNGLLALAALLAASVTSAADTLDPAEATNHAGEEVTVCGEVTGAK
jgi:hypothetical protein